MSLPQSVQVIATALQSGEARTAEQLCRAGLIDAPQDEQLLALLGMALQLQGNTAGAAQVHGALASRFPDEVSHWNNLGAALRELQHADEAIAAYRRALALDGHDPVTLFNLGLLLLQKTDYAAARDILLQASARDPAAPLARIHAAQACFECRDIPSVERLLEPWPTWSGMEEAAWIDLAALLAAISRVHDAESVLRGLLPHALDRVRVQARLALVYERSNRLREAEERLALLPDSAVIADLDLRREVVSANVAVAMRANRVEPARAWLEELRRQGIEDSENEFLLGRIHDRQGDTTAAMRAFGRAHALQMRKFASLMLPELRQPDASPLSIVPSVTTYVDADEVARWQPVPAPPPGETPLFIVGFPRSGTTMLEQMLDAHPTLCSMDEQPLIKELADRMEQGGLRYPQDLGALDATRCADLRAHYFDLAAKRARRVPGQRLVDKNPLNMLWLPMIQRVFPDARIVLALRHPCDVILSCYMQNFRSGLLMALSASLERLAESYLVAMRCWLHHAAAFSPHVLALRYEDLLADFAGVTRRLGDFAGLDDVAPLLAFHEHARRKAYIGTPSYSQVIEPPHTNAVDRWRRYEDHLRPLLPTLEPILRRFGYHA